jgi:hypothetical protein|uniref:Uncharacterized protein n=1 Tax=viral metagenome TaxID=1070528 RepID=A0A6C0IUI2_9ZZZZ
MSLDKQVITVTPDVATVDGQRPVIVFNQLSNEQFDKVLALFKPEPRTQANLWRQEDYSKDLIKCAAFCEASMFTNPSGSCFTNIAIENNFDNCMISQFKKDDNGFMFSIREWFTETRGPIPKLLKEWDPNGYDPMPNVKTNVDWFKKLTDVDRTFPGFLKLLSHCIDLEEDFAQQVSKRKHGASTAFGDHPGTKMPDPIHQDADFGNFTASRLLADRVGAGLQFGYHKN